MNEIIDANTLQVRLNIQLELNKKLFEENKALKASITALPDLNSQFFKDMIERIEEASEVAENLHIDNYGKWTLANANLITGALNDALYFVEQLKQLEARNAAR